MALTGLRALDAVPALLFLLVVLVIGLHADQFLTVDSFRQVLQQAAPIVVVATGMTFVLLVGGVDLSVGAIMFVGAGLAGQLAVGGVPLVWCALLMMGVGLAAGAINAFLVTRLRLVAFIATLATLYIGRGVGRWVTETRAINLPDAFLALGSTSWLGLPLPVWVALVVTGIAEWVLRRTPFGRRLYAVGADADAARRAGLNTGRLIAAVYVVSGLCAGIGGLLALAQLGAVSPRFGELYEFDAITASVLGGTSLFGGRGRVLPGTVLGALLLRTIYSGLVVARVDPYAYPLITAAVIFLAVLLDSQRHAVAERLARRVIR